MADVRPAYYQSENGIECIEAMIAAYGREKVVTFCKLNAFKYLWRNGKKAGAGNDLEKANTYLDIAEKLTKEQESEDYQS